MAVVLFGAFDRFNYGDLLFPLVITESLKRHQPQVDIHYAGQIFSDFSSAGGFAVKPLSFYKSVYGADSLDIVHVGGEILGCRASHAILMNMPQPYADLLMNLFQDDGLREVFEKCLSSSLGYVETASEGGRIYFNAVGGSSIDRLNDSERQELGKALRKASYISVRDLKTKSLVDSFFNLEVLCAPDCAVLISKLFQGQSGFSASHLSGHGVSARSYCVVQINRDMYEASKEQLALELCRVYEENKLAICLLPIGTAAFHEDDVALEGLYFQLLALGVPVVLYPERNVFSIMSVIRHAAFVICTSLHGRITALSFGVPRVTLFYGDQKQEAYIRTWESEIADVSMVNSLDIVKAVRDVRNIDSKVYEDIARESVSKAEASLEALISSLRVEPTNFTNRASYSHGDIIDKTRYKSYLQRQDVLSSLMAEKKANDAIDLRSESVDGLRGERYDLKVSSSIKRVLKRIWYKIG